MIIYCHSTLEEDLRSKLINALSQQDVIHFGSDIEDKNEAQKIFQTADYLLGNPPVEWFENKPANLKFWQLDSAGFDQYSSIGLPEDVKIANMGNWFARPCAETIVGGVLTLYRGLDTLIQLKQKSEWIGAKLLRRRWHGLAATARRCADAFARFHPYASAALRRLRRGRLAGPRPRQHLYFRGPAWADAGAYLRHPATAAGR